jgi:formylglycine-generating enzyme required for sulfatase activity
VISVQPGSGLQIRHRGTLRGHAAAVWWVAFSPDDRTLASAGVDMAIKLWDVSGGHEVQEMTGHRGEVRCVTFAPDGRTLASASGDRSIVVWDREDGEMKRQITGHTGDVRSVVFMPSGKQLVSGSVDKTIRFWDPQSGSEQRKLDAHRAAVQSVACSPNGKTIASASDDKTICLLNPETGELLQTLTGHADGVTQAAFSPDGRRLASASWDKTIRIWEVATGKLLLTIDKQEAAVRSVAFSANGKRLASGGDDNTIWLWDAEKGKELATLRGHRGPVTSVAFSADGRILASASADRTVMMWELEEADPAKPVDRPSVAATGRQPAKDQPAGPKPSVTELERGKQPAKDAVGPTPLPASPTPNTIAPKQPQEPPSVGPATVAKVPEEKPQGPPAADRPPEPKPAEWITLEIERELLGWKAYGSGTWSVEAGGVLKGEGGSGWLGTDQDYDDFELKLEFRLGKDSNSGIFLRAWPNGQPDGRDFLKIQLLDDTSPKFAAVASTERTASVYETVAPSPPVRGTPGEWHAITIRAEGPTVKVQYDGQAVIDVDLKKADAEIEGHRRTSGRIGLQTLSGTVEFRNIAIRRLVRPQSAAASPTPPLAITPFDAAMARKHQEAWAKYLGVPVEMTNSIGMRFVLIPPGEFDMGSTEAEVAKLLEEAKSSWHIDRLPSEAPKHRIRITKPFWLGAYEVTRGQFRRFVEDRGYQTEAERDGKGGFGHADGQRKEDPRFVWNADLGFEHADNHPVLNVSWNDVTAFCAWLSEQEGETFHLPTEAQWEYACRAGTTTTWSTGDDAGALWEHGWFTQQKTHPVGQKPPNAWGLHDMHGNVWEWCQDWWAVDYYGVSPLDDPTGPTGGSLRVRRGGSWGNVPSNGRAPIRDCDDPSSRGIHHGFRVARAVSSSDSEYASPKKTSDERPQTKDSPSETLSAPAAPPSAKPVPPWNLPVGSPPPAIAPFDAEKARKHQEAWAKYLGVEVESENSLGMRFVLIPPGEFDMGSTEAEVAKLLEEAKATNQWSWYIERLPSEAPKHRVRITKPFYLSASETTQAQYERVMGSNPSKFKEDTTCPVEMVNWDEASAFCRKLGELPEERSARGAYRLPTEAEWEYGCRAGTTATWYSGDDETGLKEVAWYSGNAGGKTHPVCEKRRNAWGLYDMHGNVWEWCQDWWVADYYGASPLDDPTGPAGGSHRVRRGGGWGFDASYGRASGRGGSDPGGRRDDLGFRLARTVSVAEDGVVTSQKSVAEPPQSKDSPSEEPPSPVTPPSARPAPPWTLPADAPAPAIAPFDAAKAKEHQAAWAKHLGVPVEMTNSIGMKFVLIPPGEFDMGSTEEEVAKLLEEAKATNQPSWYLEHLPPEAPKHRVRITKPFYLGLYEVTQAQHERVTGANSRQFKDDATCPVVNVSWNDATAFCQWLSEKEDKNYHLPSEAQWDYACRAGTTTKWYSGDDEGALKEHAWYRFNSEDKSHPVGQKSPNAWGLYDMHGNVWEWCQDWFGDQYYATAPMDDPPGASGGLNRVNRGGSWSNFASDCRASCRRKHDPDGRHDRLGFRLAMTVSVAEDGVVTSQKSVAEPPQTKDSPSETPSAPAAPPSAKPVPPWNLPVGSPPPAIAPFDAEKARKHQEAWAKYLGVEVESENSLGMRFVLIPPGEFDMGSTEAEVAKLLEKSKTKNQPRWFIELLRSEAPKHRVRITKPFWLDVYEVTRGQFRRIVEERGYMTEAERDGKGGYEVIDGQWRQDPRFVWNRDLGFEQADDHPVVNVTWNDVTAFCQWLSEKDEFECHLPTEAQWEYACRAGTTTRWYSGDDEEALKEHAWFSFNAEKKTHPVGQKSPNAWGLCDLHGNVWEWCQDWWAVDYYAVSPLDDPTGPKGGSYSVCRGGSWYDGASDCRASYRRRWGAPGFRGGMQGFRLARAVSLSHSESATPQESGAESPQSQARPTPKPPAPATTPSATNLVSPWNLPAGSPLPAVAPFDAKKAIEHQAAWAKHLGVPVEMTNSIGMKFVLIPPGEFDMGSTEEEVAKLLEEAKVANQLSWYIDRLPGKVPRHRVRITKPFYLATSEVTQAQYERVTGNSPSRLNEHANCPVEMVNWGDSLVFCGKLAESPEEQASRAEYRLPTEAEWEFSCCQPQKPPKTPGKPLFPRVYGNPPDGWKRLRKTRKALAAGVTDTCQFRIP